MATSNAIQSFVEPLAKLSPDLRIRAVVVDDYPEIVSAVQFFLQRSGVENVGSASNGRLGVELVHSTHPDLVIMDVNMPEMNGLLASAEIRSLLPDTKIIVMSADEDPDLASAALESGADDFLSKMKLSLLSHHVARLFPERIRVE